MDTEIACFASLETMHYVLKFHVPNNSIFRKFTIFPPTQNQLIHLEFPSTFAQDCGQSVRSESLEFDHRDRDHNLSSFIKESINLCNPDHKDHAVQQAYCLVLLSPACDQRPWSGDYKMPSLCVCVRLSVLLFVTFLHKP